MPSLSLRQPRRRRAVNEAWFIFLFLFSKIEGTRGTVPGYEFFDG